jgi:putative transposase
MPRLIQPMLASDRAGRCEGARAVAAAEAERTARTEVTDRMLIFGERHLRVVMTQYEAHYNGRQIRPPRPGHPIAGLSRERIRRRHIFGGLLNEYQRAA